VLRLTIDHVDNRVFALAKMRRRRIFIYQEAWRDLAAEHQSAAMHGDQADAR
jgi:hypothetical protein